MQQSFTKNYINIYFWQSIAIVLNLLSMFVVTPRLTSVPTIYGIYTISISIAIFLNYADFGFVSAGYKFASERFATGEREEEIKYIGFVSFILAVMIGAISAVFIYLAFHPSYLIKGFHNDQELKISSSLLFILAFSSPTAVIQRILQIIYGIRLEDFILQQISIVFSAIKISSIFFFFSGSKYDIVGYFFFFQLMNLIAAVVSLLIARKRYRYDFRLLLKSMKFSGEIYEITKKLAFGSLFLTGMWILYYEIDSVVIGKFLGPESVAFYAIGLTMMSFFRNVLGPLYNPFSARFNHMVGLNDQAGLKSLFTNVFILLSPLVVFTVLCVVFLAKPFILSWVGAKYIFSVGIAQLLIMSYFFTFITYPGGTLIIAKQKIKLLYVSSAILPLIYWLGIIASVKRWGLTSFAFFKFLSFTVYAMILFFTTLKLLEIPVGLFLKKVVLPIVFPSVVLILFLRFFVHFMPSVKSVRNLMVVIGTGGMGVLISFGIYYFCSPVFKNYSKKVFKTIFLR